MVCCINYYDDYEQIRADFDVWEQWEYELQSKEPDE